jgi:hypothetical protein
MLRRIPNAAPAADLCPSTVEAARVLVKTTSGAVSRSWVTECGTRCSGRVGELTAGGNMFSRRPESRCCAGAPGSRGARFGQGRCRIRAPAPGGRHWGLQSEVAGSGAPRRRVSRRPHGHECARTLGAGAPNSLAGLMAAEAGKRRSGDRQGPRPRYPISRSLRVPVRAGSPARHATSRLCSACNDTAVLCVVRRRCPA